MQPMALGKKRKRVAFVSGPETPIGGAHRALFVEVHVTRRVGNDVPDIAAKRKFALPAGGIALHKLATGRMACDGHMGQIRKFRLVAQLRQHLIHKTERTQAARARIRAIAATPTTFPGSFIRLRILPLLRLLLTLRIVVLPYYSHYDSYDYDYDCYNECYCYYGY